MPPSLRKALFAVALGVLLTAGCREAAPTRGTSAEGDRPVNLFAAASTGPVLEKITADFQTATGTHVNLNPEASSTLARQIEQGAPADLFLSADEDWADYLEKKGLVARRRDLLTNSLVVVVPAGSPLEVHDLEDLAQPAVKRLAVAGPAVPAGRYAREALGHNGVWQRVQERVLEGGNVRAVLTYVAQSEAEAGLVYGSDAMGEKRVRVALTVKPELHTPIRYPLVLLKSAESSPAASRLYDDLEGAKAAEAFRQAGFGIAR